MDWLLFISVSVVLILAPGPDIVFLTMQALSNGPRAGIATALGLTIGNLGHTLAAVLGLSLLFRQSPLAFHALQAAGVLYLLYLAWQTLRLPVTTGAMVEPEKSSGSLFRRGLLMNLLNPKVALFFIAFLPQFAHPTTGNLSSQMLALGCVFTLLVLLVFGSIGLLAGHLGQWLRPFISRSAHLLSWLGAGIFITLALRLALVQMQ